jgi:hypothetical protein
MGNLTHKVPDPLLQKPSTAWVRPPPQTLKNLYRFFWITKTDSDIELVVNATVGSSRTEVSIVAS